MTRRDLDLDQATVGDMRDSPYSLSAEGPADHESLAPGPGLFEVISRYRSIVIGTTLAAALIVYGLSLLDSTVYEAESTLLLRDPSAADAFGGASGGTADLARYVRNQAEFAQSAAVAGRTVDLLDQTLTIDDVLGSVTAVAARDRDIITITARRPTAEQAARLADTIGEAYEALVTEQVQMTATTAIAELTAAKAELQRAVDDLNEALLGNPDNLALLGERDLAVARVVAVDSRITQIGVNMSLYGSGVQYRAPAEIPASPASPRPVRNAGAAAVLGLLASIAFAWWRTEHAPGAESRHDPAPILGAPLLGEIPEFKLVDAQGPAPVIHQPASAAAEAYRFVASSVDYAIDRLNARLVAITSIGPGDGKTVTSLNLAAALAEGGSTVLLVDADERKKTLTAMGGDVDRLGLTDLATGDEVRLDSCLVRWNIGADRSLMVLPAGSRRGTPSPVFRMASIRKVMELLRGVASIVIVDSPPLLVAAESLDIASEVDAIILVVNRGTSLDALHEAVARLEMAGKPLVGYVFNRASRRDGRYGSRYGYGYGHGNEHESE